jgi:GTP-binding protein
LRYEQVYCWFLKAACITQLLLGIVPYDDLSTLAIADLPGLLPGASRNYGLGHAFLRHTARCPVLLYVLDLCGADRPLDQLAQLRHELNTYRPGLGDRPAAVVANKLDLAGAEERLAELAADCPLEVFPISGKTGLGLTHMLTRLKQIHSEHSEELEGDEEE